MTVVHTVLHKAPSADSVVGLCELDSAQLASHGLTSRLGNRTETGFWRSRRAPNGLPDVCFVDTFPMFSDLVAL